MHTQFLS